MSIQVIKINQENVLDLTPFAKEVYIDYYKPRLPKGQAEYMVETFLSEKAILKKLKEDSLLSLYLIDDEKVGFVEYKMDEERIFLSKLYVKAAYRHQGIGKSMLEEVKEYATRNHKEAIYLTVNKYNTDSIEIYKKLHFEIIDAVVNDIGQGYVMDDYIMELKMT